MIPIKNYIVVEEVNQDSVSEGGLFLPKVEKSELNFGKVMAVGPDAKADIKVGQEIYYVPQTAYRLGNILITDLDSVMGIKE